MADAKACDNPSDRSVPVGEPLFSFPPSRGFRVRRVPMLIGPVLALLLFVLLYKRDVNPAGTVWVPPALRHPQPAWQPPTALVPPAQAPVGEPLDLNDVFRRR